MPFSNKNPNQITEADLVALIGAEPESKFLDYKRDIVGNGDGDRKEFLYDISSTQAKKPRANERQRGADWRAWNWGNKRRTRQSQTRPSDCFGQANLPPRGTSRAWPLGAVVLRRRIG